MKIRKGKGGQMIKSTFHGATRQRLGVANVILMGCLITGSAVAKLGGPVTFGLGTADPLSLGRPVEVLVVVQAGADIQSAQFAVLNSPDWQLLDGTLHWHGTLGKAESREFRFRAVPLKSNPEPIRSSMRVPAYDEQLAVLDPKRMGGHFPEHGSEQEEQGRVRESQAEKSEVLIRAIQERELTEPATATEPRVPGQLVQPRPTITEKQSGRNAAVNVTGTGRFTYLDDNGVRQPVRFATVELWDLNPGPSFGDALCGKGLTDANGNFSVTGTCGDFTDGPDLFARIVLNNNRIEVKPDNPFAGSYTFQTVHFPNRPPGGLNFGTITINQNVGAFAIHNLATRAQRFMTAQDEVMSKVTINFPHSGGAHYNGFFDSLNIPEDRAFGEVATVFHEYAHHILDTKAESPLPDYSREHEDCDGSHCIKMPETVNVAWTEGFPNFYAFTLWTQFRTSDGYPGETKYSCETMNINSDFDGEEDKIEGVVCAILWDLTDAHSDDASERRDNINLSFADVWEVVKNFDPSNDILHNHPTTIHEFYSGLRIFQLSNINRIAEVYSGHDIQKPQPNLVITALQNPPQAVAPSQSFHVSNTVRNSGNELANNGFGLRFELIIGGRSSFRSHLLGTRTVSTNLAAGASTGATTALTVPSGIPPGTYTLRVCADTGSAVPESDEGDNCRRAPITTTVR
ncbi:MAG TPA: CARDB domain-containing protein [Bryobacteraceae bacterium]|nr:CARDB domain-containing protein [Bryobacteraceae bacterium]